MLFTLPTLVFLLKPQAGQQFSYLYLLGADHTFETVPFDLVEGVQYLVYLGVGNELGSSSYYTIYVKFNGQNDIIPNIDLPTMLPPLYEYKIFLQNGETWQAPLTFKINKIAFANLSSSVSIVNFNELNYSVNKTSDWNPNKAGYYYNLIFELWIYNSTLGISHYNDRFISLALNMTF